MNKDLTGNVEIYREPHVLGGIRVYSILVNGEKVGSVKNGATAIISLDQGTHSILIKIDCKKSNAMTINTEIGKTIKLKIGYNKLSGWKLYVLSGLYIAMALVGATFGIAVLVGIGVAGFMFNRGKLYLRHDQET